MTFQGRSPLSVVETPDWEIPPQWDESPTTRGADAYKLGLAVMRLFARSQSERLPDTVEPYVPTALRDLLREALGSEPGLRPSAGRWQGALRDVLGTPLAEDFPGPPSKRSAQAGRPGRSGNVGAGPPRRGNVGAVGVQPPATTTTFQAPPLVGAMAGAGTTTPIAAPGAPAAHTGALGPSPPIPPPPLAPGSRPRTGWPRRRARITLVLIVIAAAVIANALLHSSSSSTPPATSSSTAPLTGQGSQHRSARRPTASTGPRSHPGRPRSPRQHASGGGAASGSAPSSVRSSTGSASSAVGRSSAAPTGQSSASPSDQGSTAPTHREPPRPGPAAAAPLEGSAEQPRSSSGGSGGLQGSAQSESGSGGGGGGGLQGSAQGE